MDAAIVNGAAERTDGQAGISLASTESEKPARSVLEMLRERASAIKFAELAIEKAGRVTPRG
jgi:hypothetical protein